MPERSIYKLPSLVLLAILLGSVTACDDAPDAEQGESQQDKAGALEQTDSGAQSQLQSPSQPSDLAPLPDALENTNERERPLLDLNLPESDDPIADEVLDFSRPKAQPDYFAPENQRPEQKKKVEVGGRVISEPTLETHYEEWVKGAEVKIEIQTGQKKSKN